MPRIEPDYPPVTKLWLNMNDIVLALDNYDLMKSGRWPVSNHTAISSGLRGKYPAATDFIDEILRRLQHCGRDGRMAARYYIEYRSYGHAERELKCLGWINDFTRNKWDSTRLWQVINSAIRYIAKTKPRRTKHGHYISYKEWKEHRIYAYYEKIDTIKNT